MIEKSIEVATLDGTMPTYVFHPEGEGPHPAVIFYFDIFGIRDELKTMCRRFARAGYYTVLPSLFYRMGNPSYNPEKFMNGNLDLEKTDPLHPVNLNTSTTNAMVINDTGALLRHLGKEEPQADAQRVGSIGTCMGGRHALFAATAYPNQVLAFASIHGGKLVTDASDSPHLAIPKLKAEGYFGWADQDAGATEEHLQLYKTELTRCDVPHRIDFIHGAIARIFLSRAFNALQQRCCRKIMGCGSRLIRPHPQKLLRHITSRAGIK